MIYTLLLVFILNGQLVVEQKDFDSAQACNEAGDKRVQEVVAQPKFESGLLAGCIAQEKSKS